MKDGLFKGWKVLRRVVARLFRLILIRAKPVRDPPSLVFEKEMAEYLMDRLSD
jgi:hypothetical protein